MLHYKFIIFTFNPLPAEFYWGSRTKFAYAIIFRRSEKIVEIVHGRQGLILLNQYHGCWWLVDTRSQGINSHGIDLILQETRRVIFLCFTLGEICVRPPASLTPVVELTEWPVWKFLHWGIVIRIFLIFQQPHVGSVEYCYFCIYPQ